MAQFLYTATRKQKEHQKGDQSSQITNCRPDRILSRFLRVPTTMDPAKHNDDPPKARNWIDCGDNAVQMRGMVMKMTMREPAGVMGFLPQ
jgi:hypothetical protein